MGTKLTENLHNDTILISHIYTVDQQVCIYTHVSVYLSYIDTCKSWARGNTAHVHVDTVSLQVLYTVHVYSGNSHIHTYRVVTKLGKYEWNPMETITK